MLASTESTANMNKSASGIWACRTPKRPIVSFMQTLNDGFMAVNQP